MAAQVPQGVLKHHQIQMMVMALEGVGREGVAALLPLARMALLVFKARLRVALPLMEALEDRAVLIMVVLPGLLGWVLTLVMVEMAVMAAMAPFGLRLDRVGVLVEGVEAVLILVVATAELGAIMVEVEEQEQGQEVALLAKLEAQAALAFKAS